ncbi:hypothetical protein [Neptunicella sp.]|uniref:hypothetical protein n=1 Tax=Neptunicella sp. TaxID=2125986 RepID=UPI003F692908
MTQLLLITKMQPMVEKPQYPEFAARLNTVIKAENMSVRELSRCMKVTYEMARRYTLGTAKPRENKIADFADATGYSLAWLDNGEGEEKLLKNKDLFAINESKKNYNISLEAQQLIKLIETHDLKNSRAAKTWNSISQIINSFD